MAEHNYPVDYKRIGSFNRLRLPEAYAQEEMDLLMYEPDECRAIEEVCMKPATEIDIEERRLYQIERYLQLSREGGLTPEWLDFGDRNAYDITYHYLLTRDCRLTP